MKTAKMPSKPAQANDVISSRVRQLDGQLVVHEKRWALGMAGRTFLVRLA